jgi:uncharacterized protein
MSINEKHQNTKSIFYLPVLDNFLVYSPLNGISALLNQLGLIELEKQLRAGAIDKDVSYSRICEMAYTINNSQISEVQRKTGKLNPDFLGIIPTRACNGACNYCDFGADIAPKTKMPYKRVIKIVDWYFQYMLELKRNVVDIHFFGGEPMLANDVLEVAVHRARMLGNDYNMIPYFEISTNGQYSWEKAQWLGNYFNTVVLSFDGLRDVQNIHRPLKRGKDSYENAFQTAKIISDSSAELNIRCCVSRVNIKQMEELVHFFCKHFHLSSLNFEIMCPSIRSDSEGLYPPDPVEFAIQFQKARTAAKIYNIDVVYASDISPHPQVTSCPVGKDTVIISPNGRISNCYLLPEKWHRVGLDFDYGFIKKSNNVQIDQSKVEAIRLKVDDKPRCTTCFCRWSCAGGCHVGNNYRSNSDGYNNFCKQTRLISAFSLLSDLGLENQIEMLFQSPKAIKSLTEQPSDLINDFKGL